MRKRIPNFLLLYFITNQKWTELLLLLLIQSEVYYKKDTIRKDYLFKLSGIKKKKFNNAFEWLRVNKFIKEIDEDRIQLDVASGVATLLNDGRLLYVLNLEDSKYLHSFNILDTTIFNPIQFKQFKEEWNLNSIDALRFAVRNYFEWNFLEEKTPRWAIQKILGISRNKQREYEKLRLNKKFYNYKHKPLRGSREEANSYIPQINLGIFKLSVTNKRDTRWSRKVFKKIRKKVVGLRDAAQELSVLNQDVSAPTTFASTYDYTFQVQSSIVSKRKKTVRESKSKLTKRIYFDLLGFPAHTKRILNLLDYHEFTFNPNYKEPYLKMNSMHYYFSHVLLHWLKNKIVPPGEIEDFEFKIKYPWYFGLDRKLTKKEIQDEWKKLRKKHYVKFLRNTFKIKMKVDELVERAVNFNFDWQEVKFELKNNILYNFKWFTVPLVTSRINLERKIKYKEPKGFILAGFQIEKLFKDAKETNMNSIFKIPAYKGVTPDFWSIHHTLSSIHQGYQEIASELLTKALIAREKAIYSHPTMYKISISKEVVNFYKLKRKSIWLMRNAIVTRYANPYQIRNKEWLRAFEKVSEKVSTQLKLTRFLKEGPVLFSI